MHTISHLVLELRSRVRDTLPYTTQRDSTGHSIFNTVTLNITITLTARDLSTSKFP